MTPPRKSVPSSPGNPDREDQLTPPIRQCIHCVAAEGHSEVECELQEIEIGHFINALAEVALAIARRREERGP